MDKKKLRNSALVFSLILIAWPIFAALTITSGSIPEQIRAVQDSTALHVTNFLVALCIAPSMLVMLVRMFPFLGIRPSRGYITLVILFYVLYLLLISISYGSQVFYLPFILKMYPDPFVEKWFFYNNESMPFAINQTGYLCWSIATLLYMIPAITKAKAVFFIALLVFLISSVLQIIATIGFYASIPEIAGLTFYSGLLMLPAGILVLVYAKNNKTS